MKLLIQNLDLFFSEQSLVDFKMQTLIVFESMNLQKR